MFACWRVLDLTVLAGLVNGECLIVKVTTHARTEYNNLENKQKELQKIVSSKLTFECIFSHYISVCHFVKFSSFREILGLLEAEERWAILELRYGGKNVSRLFRTAAIV